MDPGVFDDDGKSKADTEWRSPNLQPLDGSNPDDLELPVDIDLNFGNLNTNDWYFYSALTLAYTFGRKPCYCVF